MITQAARPTGGRSRALLPRVFDLFVQAEPGSDRSQGGLGIGLTLVKSLVEMRLALLLQLGGHDVQTAADGPRALAAAAAFRPDVVFLDIGLPGMSGYEVARQLRGGPPVTLVAVTGYGQDDDRRRSAIYALLADAG